MRKPTLLLTSTAAGALAVALAALPPTASAQRGERLRSGGRGIPPPSLLLTTIDADGDGVLDASELMGAAAALAALDANGDARLAGDELRPAGRGPRTSGRDAFADGDSPAAPGGPPEASQDDLVGMLMAFDEDGDGRLTEPEVPERLRGLFDRADANDDGRLTVDEISTSAAATPDPAGAGRGGRGGRARGVGDPILSAIDTDGDGSLSDAEMVAAGQSLLTLDRNADGRLTAGETAPNVGGRRGGRS